MEVKLHTMAAEDGAHVSYADVGTGRPIVFVGGFGEDASSAYRLIETLSPSFRVVTFEHRGYGNSEITADACVQRSARDLRNLIETLDLQDVALVGYSMGGSVSFSYVEQFGVERLNRLVLADTAPKLINENGWNLGLWQGRYTRADFDRDLETIVDNPSLFHLSFYARAATKTLYDADVSGLFPPSDDQEGWTGYVAKLTNLRESFVKRIFAYRMTDEQKACERRYWETMTGGDWLNILPKISVPTLCLYADPGSFYYSATAEYMAEQIPNAETSAIPNASHCCLKENLDDFASKIADFCLRAL